jgi:hypothetical protein
MNELDESSGLDVVALLRAMLAGDQEAARRS